MQPENLAHSDTGCAAQSRPIAGPGPQRLLAETVSALAGPHTDVLCASPDEGADFFCALQQSGFHVRDISDQVRAAIDSV